LLKSFRNEKVCINMTCRKLPFFDNIKKEKISEGFFKIIANINKNKWIFYCKEYDIFNEKDVLKLHSIKSKKDNIKISRKVIIPLKGIDQNAFLLAKNHKIWIWEKSFFNQLLRLFDKYEIIL